MFSVHFAQVLSYHMARQRSYVLFNLSVIVTATTEAIST